MGRRGESLRVSVCWLLAIAAIGFSSNQSAKYLARAGYFRFAGPGQPKPAADHESRSKRTSPTKGTDDTGPILARLLDIYRTRNELWLSFDAQAEVDRILGGLSAEQLSQIFQGLDALDETNGIDDLYLRVGAWWATLEPTAAMNAALARSKDRGVYLASSIFRSWAADHPAEALAWLDASDLIPEFQSRKGQFRIEVVGSLAEADFPLAKATLAKMSPGDVQTVWERWGHGYVEDPAMRGRLSSLSMESGSPDDHAAFNRGLMKSWPENDPLGLMGHLEDLKDHLESVNLPPEVRPRIDAEAVGAAILREYNEPALEWWMQRYSDSAVLPPPLGRALVTWARNKPEISMQWLQEQPRSPQRDAMGSVIATSLMAQQRFAQAASILGTIDNPEMRTAAAERLEILWKGKDPGAAEEWRKAQPSR